MKNATPFLSGKKILPAVFILLLGAALLFCWHYRHSIKGQFFKGATGKTNCPDCAGIFDDRNPVHMAAAKKGILRKPLEDKNELDKFLKNEMLAALEPNEGYIIENFSHSYAYLTPKTISLVNELGANFKAACDESNISCKPFIITSALRTKETVKKLQNTNSNAVSESSHLYGTTIDVAWSRFGCLKLADQQMLTRLIDCLKDLRSKNKCLVKFESQQACFHITAIQ